MRKILFASLIVLTAAAPATQTRVTSPRDAQRLLSSSGVTLQWIDWNTRGSVHVVRGPLWRISASQAQAGGPGRLQLDGDIVAVGPGSFTLRGTIRIIDTPDRGRRCEATKDWHFAITQHRPYYRLREFEWCDGLTDYIDIHF
jgi:hypothetical protein